MTPASLACPQPVVVPTAIPNEQLLNEVSFRVHRGRLTQTLPVPGPNTAATRNAVAPTIESMQITTSVHIIVIAWGQGFMTVNRPKSEGSFTLP